MSEYTKGPWITIENPTNISIATGAYGNGGRQCAFVQCKSNKGVARANARLIAAAPELLGFVRREMEATTCICQFSGLTFLKCTHCEAKSIIAKAEGRS